MPTVTTDQGQLRPAQFEGNCRVCGGSILVGQMIYFSRRLGSGHQRCVDPGEPAPAADRERAPRATTDAAPRDDRWLFDDGTPAPTPPRDGIESGVERAPARATAVGAAARDAARSVGDQIRQAASREEAKREVVEAFEALAASLRRLLLG
ncbi:MAG TPA: hypothetical protein VG826_29305 [Pirellulales bacterium]|nr:hypothetical protein [Pirellulales bacterium]